MKNLAKSSALALTSAIAMSPALAQCDVKCGAKADASLIQCPAGYQPNCSASNAAQVAAGETLFRSTKLSSNGLSCATCHTGGARFTPGFAKLFPHVM